MSVLQPSAVARRAHLAFRALNVELVQSTCPPALLAYLSSLTCSSAVRDRVSNEDLGRARASFFRDGVEAALAGSSPPAQPALEAVAEAVSDNPALPADALRALLDAREKDLGFPAPATLPELEGLCADTHGALGRLHAALLAPGDAAAEKTAAAAGTTVGLAVLLRGAPAAAASRLSYMPRVLAKELSVSPAALIIGGQTALPVFTAVADLARERANAARELAKDIPKAARPALWPLRGAGIYLKRLQAAGGDPFDERLQQSMRATYPLRLQLALLRSRLTGTL